MLEIENQEYMDSVKEFAKSKGMLDNLEQQLSYLGGYANHENSPNETKCIIGKDWAPYSFSILMMVKPKVEKEWKVWFNGGLIFHEANSSGAEAPVFSVRLGDCSKSGWMLHT